MLRNFKLSQMKIKNIKLKNKVKDILKNLLEMKYVICY